MRKKAALFAGTVGLVAAALLGASISSAVAAEPNGADEKYYLVDSNTLVQVPAPTILDWTTAVNASPIVPTTGDVSVVAESFDGPDSATGATIFVSARGNERTSATWIATAPSAFLNATTKSVILPSATLSELTNGAPATVKAGGQFSLGVAWTTNSGNTVVGASYTYITVTPLPANAFNFTARGGATWVFETPVVAPPVLGSFTQNLTAVAINGVDGNLSLVAPTNANVTIGSPTLTGGTSGLSVSTGTLGQFSVVDGRPIAKPGWRLQTTVADFSGGISKVQLGVKPVLVATGTTATGVTLGAEQVAGTAVYPSTFALAPVGTGVGTTNFNADLRFVAPAGTPAGSYTSTLTITLVAP